MPIQTKTTFSRSKLDHTKENNAHLMVTLEAPERDFERTPICAALVLDVSGSMDGSMDGSWGRGSDRESKLDCLKKVARSIAQQLSSQDEISITAYSSSSDVVLGTTKVTNKEEIYAAIDKLRTLGSTNVGSGLIDGFRCLNADFSGVKRVFLVSDGLNNVGMSNDQVLNLAKNSREYGQGITISTFGIGADCDQDLMAKIAKAGEGNYYFIENANDMKETFARELGGALACEAQNIRIKVRPNQDNEIAGILNDFTVEDKNGEAIISAEDLYVGETRHVLIEMNVAKVDHPKPRPVSVAHVDVEYHDVAEQKTLTAEYNVKVEFVKPSEADTEDVLEVGEQVAILKMATAQEEAVAAANVGDFTRAKSIFTDTLEEVQLMAAAGSDLCDQAHGMFAEKLSNFEAGNYTESFAATAMSDTSGLRKARGTVGTSAMLYSNKATSDMMDNFKQDVSVGGPTNEASAPEEAKPEDTSKSKKSFSKRRSNRNV